MKLHENKTLFRQAVQCSTPQKHRQWLSWIFVFLKPLNMKTTRRKFTSKFKAQVAIEAIKERESMTDLAKRFEVHPAQFKPK
jgi:hypothetical protein